MVHLTHCHRDWCRGQADRNKRVGHHHKRKLQACEEGKEKNKSLTMTNISGIKWRWFIYPLSNSKVLFAYGFIQNILYKLYKLLLKWYTADKMVNEQMRKWAINTNIEITMEWWEFLWKKSIRISTCVNLQENCYKLPYGWYITPKKLAKIYKDTSNLCWKCRSYEGSLYHMWWTCMKAKEFWTMIHRKVFFKKNLLK